MRLLFQNVLPVVANPLADLPNNIDGWASIHLDANEKGSSQLVIDLEEYGLSYMSSADIFYVESHKPLFDAERNEMLVHQVSPGVMTLSIMKVEQDAFRDRYGEHPVELSSFFSDHSVNPTEAWTLYQETLKLPTVFHFKNDSLCKNLPVSILAGIYDGYGKVAPLRRNPS